MKVQSLFILGVLVAGGALAQAVRPQVVQPMPINRANINSGTGTMPQPAIAQTPAQQHAADVAAGTGAGVYTPFMLSLVAPLQVPPGAFDVGGLRLSIIYGDCYDFDGLDLGLFYRSRGHANGFQAGGLSITDGDGIGFQANVLANIVWGNMTVSRSLSRTMPTAARSCRLAPITAAMRSRAARSA